MKRISTLKKIERREAMDGMTLLLQFAYGALQKNICGNDTFADKVEKYLLGDRNHSLKTDIKKEIPKQLKNAWPMLKKISHEIKNKPLAEKTVSIYIFKMHNRFVLPVCKVKTGIIKKICNGKIFVNSGKKTLVVNFLKPFGENLEIGGKIFFHHGWLISCNAPNALNK